ncbi:nitrogen regulatory protein P-II family [Tahibacter aquaticus]|uniref:Nitrogen regulatory protein P-II family n=1 Tax=Tahibacter aquaticus TaxID=520092 RepID=A0A4R6YKQ9_9GAMM|nr:P-II family nitrogen regulator [Tahibacter aquaticus]TDR37722.1 nitrogen regulatory protein P-II family [Tahibacter aquaticus]
MKAVFAYLDGDCVADIVTVLRIAGLTHLTVVSVSASLWPMSAHTRSHLPELGHPTFADVKLEVICADDEANRVIAAIRQHASAYRNGTACVVVMPLDAVIALHAPDTAVPPSA